MDKDDGVNRYRGMKGNEVRLFAGMWMDLESVIQNEVSQKEKKKMLMHTCRIEKKWYR